MENEKRNPRRPREMRDERRRQREREKSQGGTRETETQTEGVVVVDAAEKEQRVKNTD